MLIALSLLVAQLEINGIVGNEIDSLEAQKYHLFTDIPGFVSARFHEAGDSVAVALTFLQDGTAYDSVVTIDLDLFAALRSYIHNFRTIIEDREFRESFVQTFKIGWPVVSQRDIELVARASKRKRLHTTACCMSGGCGLGAYTSALLTRNITTDTVSMPVPCFVGGEPGCIFVPVEIRRYSFSELSYLAGAGVGTGLGYAWGRTQHRLRTTDLLCRAIGHDIVAFDNADFPITEVQVAAAHRSTNELLLGTLGIGAGLLAAGVTAYVLHVPWADMYAKEAWQADAIGGAVILVSLTELAIIANYFIRKGRQLDRQAAIEWLKDRQND
ncbi:hypothetical protein IBX73_02050 [candidate division WOR-3 bacterium]|nr:hypothetical protein [candidate division WOR-3 bacterium]